MIQLAWMNQQTKAPVSNISFQRFIVSLTSDKLSDQAEPRCSAFFLFNYDDAKSLPFMKTSS